MGRGFWILTWDSFGTGLNMNNARLLTDEDGNNWFVLRDKTPKETALDIFGKLPHHYKIIET
jgi:hypothetical protein